MAYALWNHCGFMTTGSSVKSSSLLGSLNPLIVQHIAFFELRLPCTNNFTRVGREDVIVTLLYLYYSLFLFREEYFLFRVGIESVD